MKAILRRTLAALTLLTLVTACSTPLEAVMDFDQRYDFTGISKIGVLPVDRAAANAAMLSDMDINRITTALTDELFRKGFTVVEDDREADLLMAWHLVTQERTDVRTYNSMSYYNCWRCGPAVSDVSVRQYTQGTFIVDMIDPLRNQSVWRSTIESRLNSTSTSNEDDSLRREAAAASFAEFPPF
ncbi:MAG: DUF4136 domain-containing protein [Pseudomonadota bacterium]